MNLTKEIGSNDRPFVIAGPCSVESEAQIVQTACALAKNTSTQVLRGGIWKPRTRPNSFEGIGEVGLQWLVNAGKEAKLPVITEIANAKHLELALKAGVDAIWIGARTTVNPFAVQEIADALQDVEIPVAIKNPINPDLQLWIGAIERIQNAGIKDIVAIHRGFSVYQHPKYRNAPNWKIPIALMEKMPQIPLLCDPSHILGKKESLLPLAQKAMDLNFEGLMIEVHPHPKEALSDAKQQIKPKELSHLLTQLILRESDFKPKEINFMVEKRKQIEQIDDQVFHLFKERMNIAEWIGHYKKENNVTILQTAHWKEMIAHRLSQQEDLQLSPQFLRQILDAIHQESIRHQTSIMNDKSKHT